MSAHPPTVTELPEMRAATSSALLIIICIVSAYEEAPYPQTLFMEAYIDDWSTHYSHDDYPENFVDRQHPDDYKAISSPLPPEFIFHNDVRLFLRISFKAGAEYIPMSFMLDTAAPSEIYFSFTALDAINNSLVVVEHDNMIMSQIPINFGGCVKKPEMFPVSLTPRSKQPGNFIGLNGLMRLGLKLNEPPGSFSLGCNISWF